MAKDRVPPRLASPVRVNAILVRTHTENAIGDPVKVWERKPLSVDIFGYYIGRRNKSNGQVQTQYNPFAYFEVYLVVYSATREVLVCLPSDVQILDTEFS